MFSATDRITFPKKGGYLKNGAIFFWLHAGLKPEIKTPGFSLEKVNREVAIKNSSDNSKVPDKNDNTPLEYFKINHVREVPAFTIKYGGRIEHALKQRGKEYAKSFKSTSGIISEQGVYLSGASFWYPRFGGSLLTFPLLVRVPEGWSTVSQGTAQIQAAQHTRWNSPQPQDEIFLIAAKFHRYQRQAGSVSAMNCIRSMNYNRNWIFWFQVLVRHF
ncbi:hypothetical protein ACFL35_08465 [Candidatus Riflebacteria bacterium]